MKITLEIDDTVAGLLATLDRRGDVEKVLHKLIDFAQQGVYRPMANERDLVMLIFGDDFLARLEPGDPYDRRGMEHTDRFNKPKQ